MSDSIQPKSSYFVRKTPNQTPQSAKQASVLNIPGTRTSLHNNQLLTPIGIPSIDEKIGGGLPVGGICLIGQDTKNFFSDIIMRCFIAEGIVHNHSIYVGNLSEEKDKLFERIPSQNKIQEPDTEKNPEQLRIAWRYGQQTQSKSMQEPSAKPFQSNYFVINKFMSKDEVYSTSNIKTFELDEKNLTEPSFYSNLSQDLTKHIDLINLNVNKTKEYNNLLRIVINSAGGLIWNDLCSINEDYSVELCKFLLNLRQLMRHSLAVCVITLPNEIIQNKDLLEKFSHLSDYTFLLDDSNRTMSRLSNTQYDGLFRLTKLPSLNSLNSCFTPETLDLAFYLKKKRLVVELMHLPPDIDENDDSQKGRTSTSLTMSCSSSTSTGSHKLDF